MVALCTQTYPPDTTAVGQYHQEWAAALRRRGHRVRVYTASAGYNDASARYAKREVRDGVHIQRLPLSSFGKQSYLARVAGVAGYAVQAALRVLFSRSVDVVTFSSSPPFSGLLIALAARVRGIPTVYWAADFAPEQLFALGRLAPGSLAGRFLAGLDRVIIRSATCVVVHDRFMAETVRERDRQALVHTVPPWPILEPAQRRDRGTTFRAREGLGDARVVMYSGNHSASNPLTTLLAAIDRIQDEVNLTYVFIGDGAEKRRVEEHAARNRHGQVRSLPYQPLETLDDVLAAGDVHVVSLGPGMVGAIHPSKIYTSLAVGRPILYLGPAPSHVTDLLQETAAGWAVEHGNVDRAATVLREIASADERTLGRMGGAGTELVRDGFTRDRLLGRMCEIVEALVIQSPREEKT